MSWLNIKQNTKDLSVSNIFWHLQYSNKIIHSYQCPNSSPVLSPEHLINSRLLTGFGILVFFTNLSLMVFQVRCLALIYLISVIDHFGWLWMGSFHMNTQLMLEFLEASFLVLHFSYYTLITFLMMQSVILLFMLMILMSTLSVISHLICGNNQKWLVNFNLICEALWTGSSKWLVDFIARKTWLVLFDRSNNAGVIDVKIDETVLDENHVLRSWDCLSLLNWIGALRLDLYF